MNVIVFKAYPFHVGQKIRIEDSPRFGDWEVVGVTEHKVTLRCPVSGNEVVWNRFCYYVEDVEKKWPDTDGEGNAE